MECIADFMMGSHLTLNGTITLVGVDRPICEGDNLEWDGVVYHIETVSHVCQIDPMSGRRMFSTTLSVTNGMRTDLDSRLVDDTISMYAGVLEGDSRSLDPGITNETDFPVVLERRDASARDEDHPKNTLDFSIEETGQQVDKPMVFSVDDTLPQKSDINFSEAEVGAL
jgi:hypothetical protein